jgi:hypothetical protein
VPGPWTTPVTTTIVGTSTPPPDIPAMLFQKPYIIWDYPERPIDFAGFRVRFHAGDKRTWDDATPATDGLLTEQRFDVSGIAFGGTQTILVRAEDTTGNLSTEPAALVRNLGDPLTDNIIVTEPYADEDFKVIDNSAEFWSSDSALFWTVDAADFWPTKSIVNGSLSGGKLVADQQGTYWTEDDSVSFWSGNNNAAFWTAVYRQMTYTTSYVPPTDLAGEALSLATTITASAYTLEYRADTPLPYWSADSAPAWSDDDATFWNTKPAFRAWPGRITDISRQKYEFRIVTQAGNTQGQISEFTPSIDVPDVTETLNDVSISSSGTRLPITETYRKILNVNLTLQDDGGSAVGLRTADKDADLGPLVEALSQSNTLTSASIDATIQGY